MNHALPAAEDPPGPLRFDRLTSRAAAVEVLAALPWLDAPDTARAALRLRHKHGTNARVGAVLPTAAGPAAVLVAQFATPDKAVRLVAGAARHGLAVYRDGSLVAVPAAADPALRRLPPAGTALAYNPARRWVGRVGDEVVKVHAVAPPAAITALLTAPPAALARHLAPVRAGRGGRLVHAAWTAGHPPTAGDLPAVRAALEVLHATMPPANLPTLDEPGILAAARRAAASVADALPGEWPRLAALLGALDRACEAGAWPRHRVLVHGDLSPDQVLVDGGHAVLLDLDRAALGPPGWDAATWEVAQLAAGGSAGPQPAEGVEPPGVKGAAAPWVAAAATAPGVAPAGTTLPGPAVAPVLVLAAALLRAPEPFRRLRADWPERTRAVLDRAEDAVWELAPAAPAAPAVPAASTRAAPTELDRLLAGVPAGLSVGRAWPRPDGLAVEARRPDGRLVALVVTAGGARPLAGADPDLPALAPALARPAAVLLGHRPGRRAVLREPDGHYLKIVRPGRAAKVVDGLRRAAALLGDEATVPEVCAADVAAGWVRLAPLPGPSLHDLLRTDAGAAFALCARLSPALAALRARPAGDLPRHGADDEVEVVRGWLRDADRFTGGGLAGALAPVAAALRALPATVAVPCHRDLHDKQVLALGPAHRRVALLDLDTLCAADPALDLGNLLAHLRLCALQGVVDPVTARRCARALHTPGPDPAGLDVAGPDPAAVTAYTAAALLRLAAVHSFRPGAPGLPARLAADAVDHLRRTSR